MFRTLTDLFKDESGATAIEYGLIAALVSVAAIGAMSAMGGSLDTMFTSVSDALCNNLPEGAVAPEGCGAAPEAPPAD
jgi:pilus assembly protein Flp/PilA|tara:strand:- start:9035 stop:9268 length:234 start_codon:yes stop_codon:yes gene_type:complete